MATEGFTFTVPANFVNITVTAAVMGNNDEVLRTVTNSSGISAAVSPAFSINVLGSTVDPVTNTTVTVSYAGGGIPTPTTTYTWNFMGEDDSTNNTSSFTITDGQTGPLTATVRLDNALGFTSAVADFGIVGNIPYFYVPPYGIPTAASGSTVGDVLTIVQPISSCTPSATFSYAWYLGGVTIDDQTSLVYTTTIASPNAAAIVTGTNRHGITTATVNFGPVRSIASTAPFFASGPTADAHDITVGDVATVVGAVGGNPVPDISYTWSLDGSVIAGAAGSTYTTTTAGTELLAGISASNSEGTITGTADFGSVSVVSSLTKNFAPDFALANTQPSESIFDNGGHTGGIAVGYIEMLLVLPSTSACPQTLWI